MSDSRAYMFTAKTPIRVQRKRTKGWKMPPNTVYVGRGTKWGNPFIVGDLWENQGIDRRLAVRLFRYMLQGVPSFAAFMFSTSILKNRLEILENIHELRGKNLACWCPLDQPCHADVLLELANK